MKVLYCSKLINFNGDAMMKKPKDSSFNLKAFLESNKIYFETIAATSLTIMALIVSYNSNQISNQQLEIQKGQLAANFRYEYSYTAIYVTGSESQVFVKVYNDGSSISNLQIDVVESIKVRKYRSNEIIETSHYCCDWDTTLTRDETIKDDKYLGTLRGKRINQELYEKTLKKIGQSISYLDWETFAIIKLTYKNSYGKVESEYHTISFESDYPQLEQSKAEYYFNKFKSEPAITLEDTPNEVIQRWKSKIE
ncbi:hypothetical protein V9K67_20600 [Paraflavisolibacter sp. H34]|uniref:hypothetical protein n=1 Tax=Huijunlia imazamoxiresistens TaxID=3127457 RepID=UPI00301AA33D